jgi:hypothetical protein
MKRSNQLSRRAVILVAVGVATVALPVQAFRMIQNTSVGRVTAGSAVVCNSTGGFAHWAPGTASNIGWWLNPAGQGAGKVSAIQWAMQSWTNVAGASHVLNYMGTTTAGFVTDNRNTVSWSTGNGCTGSCLALTALVLQSDQVIVESDITFNANYSWQTNGTDYDTQAVATHEFGHSLGIHHTEVTSSPLPTMYSVYLGTGGRSIEADDRSALVCADDHYGLPPTCTATFSCESGPTLNCEGNQCETLGPLDSKICGGVQCDGVQQYCPPLPGDLECF